MDHLQDLFARATKLIRAGGGMLFWFPNADSLAGMGAQNDDFTQITAIGGQTLHQLVEPWSLWIDGLRPRLPVRGERRWAACAASSVSFP